MSNKFRVTFGHGVVVVPNEKIRAAVEAALMDMDISGTASVEMREFDGYIQYSTDGNTWKNVIALSDLKGDPGKPGQPGTTPHIGANGNWYIGDTDTGIPAQGAPAVTAESIEKALGYIPAESIELDELEMVVDELEHFVGMKPTVFESQLDGNTIIINEKMELLTAYTQLREVLICGFAENKALVAKVYPRMEMLPTPTAVGTLFTLNGDGMDGYTAENCVIDLVEEGDHVVGNIVVANTAIADSDNTEIAEYIDYDLNVKSVNHRGYSAEAPENTIPAYILSKQKGFKYVECDVSFTSDGVAVLLHDATIDRTSNGSGNINSITYNDALNYDFGSWKSSAYAGTKIPTFEEFIMTCKAIGLHPYIELKNNGGYTQEQITGIVNTVKKAGMEGKVTYISFSASYLGYVKAADGSARIGYLSSSANQTVIDTALGLKTSGNAVFVDIKYTAITDAFVSLCAENNLPLEIWTVNSQDEIEGMNSYVTGVTSDNLIAGKILYDKYMTYTAPEVENVTLVSISATYTGGNVPVGTSVNSLKGLVVTGAYSNGTTSPVTGYTLSGTIAEGTNTITVSYGGKTTTFTVTGTAQEEPDEPEIPEEQGELLYSWDFTKSLVDEVSGNVATVSGVNNENKIPTITQNGLVFEGLRNACIIENAKINGTRIVMEIANADAQFDPSASNGRVLMLGSYDDGFCWSKKNNEWGVYNKENGGWSLTTIAECNYISGKTLTVDVYNNHATWYLNGSTIVDNGYVLDTPDKLWIGSADTEGHGFYNLTVRSLKIYKLPGIYTIERNFTGCKSNSVATAVTSGATYTETITATDGCEISDVDISVTMGGVDISHSVVNGVLTIPTVTGDIVITANLKNGTLLYNWDFTDSLTDTKLSKEAVLSNFAIDYATDNSVSVDTSATVPIMGNDGVSLNQAGQYIYLGNHNLIGRTIEIDVEEFDFKGSASYNIRLVGTANLRNYKSTTIGYGPLIFKNGTGWTAYLYDGSNMNWSGSCYTGLNGVSEDIINYFSKKTIKLVYATDRTITLYVDDVLVGSPQGVKYRPESMPHLFIGGMPTVSASNVSTNQTHGNQCYDMTVSAVRIYHGAKV